ncbi:MAG: stage II sporulation E family protein [Ignavibacteria bacterium]|nr:MAG: stage II sporulation E family protein [Ignavibacteria bacterium]KAF0160350.1 MAG: stage II sporulation E family protein [Ignavibacteria bacterium]
MEQRKLYKTIESIAAKDFTSDTDLLSHVLKQIVSNEEIQLKGGRIWKFEAKRKAYRLIFQTGKVQKIQDDFLLYLKDYPYYERIAYERTILADETNKTLISKGINKYSASGIGRKIKIGDKRYYEYLLAVNSAMIGDDLRDTLNIVATVLTSKLNEHYLVQSSKNLIADIDKAKEIQRSILPEHEYRFHNYDIFGVTLPAQIVGGDFYDYLKIGEGEDRLGIVVGDAASKGLGAAAEAMYISGAMRMASSFQIKISLMFSRMNQLVNKIFSDDKFSSLFYGELSDDKKGLFLYANAGHNPPMFYRKKFGEIALLHATGPLLGPAPNAKFETDHVNFRNGDIMIIYSDGVVEAANDKFDLYSEERLSKVILENVNRTPKEICLLILEDVQKFSTSESQYQDDKTIVVIKRNDKNESNTKNI